jgi:hypothetical protein
MDFTVANGYKTHSATGHRMHQTTEAIPTAITALDFNQIIWSLMALLGSTSVSAAAFDPDNPSTYHRVRDAVFEMAHPLHRPEPYMGGVDPNALYPWSEWELLPPGVVLVNADPADTAMATVGAQLGSKSVTLTKDQLPAHAHMLPVSDETSSGGAVYGTATDTSTLVEDFTNALTSSGRYLSSSVGGGQAVSLMQPSLVVEWWVRTA